MKRLLTLAVWFYCGWTAGAFASFILNLPVAFGPALGMMAALAFVSSQRSRQRSRRRDA